MTIEKIHKHIQGFVSSIELLDDDALKVEASSLLEIARQDHAVIMKMVN